MLINDVSLIVSIASVVVTAFGVIVAVVALYRWKHEFNWKETYSAFVQCEMSIYEYHRAIKSLGGFYYRNTQIQLNSDDFKGYVEKDSEIALTDKINKACERLKFQQDWLASFTRQKLTDQLDTLISSYLKSAIDYTENCSFCGFLSENQTFEQYHEKIRDEANALDEQFAEIKKFLRKYRG
ncbi:hypothetical protein OC506_20550 [Vibrio vulnificus]|nr:hypothetical protein [Vibrio vulnificus]MCU8426229.1 hypothetical protein [Vibrio vulnificus]MCU8430646.1 hypothetical protein [Vibrio vulnificus]